MIDTLKMKDCSKEYKARMDDLAIVIIDPPEPEIVEGTAFVCWPDEVLVDECSF